MTKYNELQVTANHDTKRVGRGIAGGGGKTAGRGTKGQNSRTGKKNGPMFAGNSRTLVTAIPKARGFKSLRTPAQVVYLENLNLVQAKVIDNHSLYKEGFIFTPFQAVKVILRGELTKAINLQVSGASKSVKAAVEKAGGTFVKTAVPLKMSVKAAEKADQE